jgi:glycerol-3-phosphate cytidylyltransferase
MKVGFTCSTFDLFHAGHIIMLKEAKAQCDYLIVGLQTDPTIDRKEKNTPVQSIFERFVQLQACKYVDEIVVYATEKDLVDILLSYPINVRILGEEYEHREFTGRSECIARGIKFYFNRREHTFSTTELRQRVVDAEADKLIRKANDL